MLRPTITPGTHPIEQGQYILPTLEINRLMEKIIQIIKDGGPGMIVYGRPRLGKTRATIFAVSYLPAELETLIPIFVADCKSYKVPSAEKFYRDMLHDFFFRFETKKDEVVLRSPIVNLMHEKGERSNLRRVVLIMDEAQKMTEWQYNCLIDISNQLMRKMIRMTIISIGQEQLVDRRSFFIANQKAHIVGRFMPKEYEFKGIRSVEELEYVLQSYDESEYPTDSGWYFTRFFFPESYDEGKRLKDFGKLLFNLFLEIRQEFGITGKMELPMEYVAFTIENALKTYGANGMGGDWLSMLEWRDAISRSGYIDSELLSEVKNIVPLKPRKLRFFLLMGSSSCHLLMTRT
ncbi:ATP-binding protein [Paenibacillus sp. LHD-38]|uniref:ATP-binding protein n=1 Tax=Paenibacillus sp. LHD-38 TaxID=3072143 RepID=UPI00280C924D|nr:ATP-binding protein [Paenibacillus sp. LHD-38]MDQ8739160.1 ATP-binding protein [Paenibacillus sp. LHD-38]